MPFKSQAQRGFMYSHHPKMAKEFEAATPKEENLPYHVKKAYGGEIPEKPTFGSENPDLDNLRQLLALDQGNEEFTLSGKTPDKSLDELQGEESTPHINTEDGKFLGDFTETIKPKMAGGGDISNALRQLSSPLQTMGAPGQAMGQAATQAFDAANPLMRYGLDMAANNINMQRQPQVDQGFINQLNTGMNTDPNQATPPPSPNLSQAAQTAQQGPPTNPNLYKGISAEDRAALMQKLIAQKSSPGGLFASALTGLGDVVTGAYGKTPTNMRQQLEESQNKNIEQRAGIMDTQRQQRTQDMQANIEVQMNDPKSAMSQSMQKTLRSAGLNVGSNMPGSVMLKIAGPLGELAFKQAQVQEMHFGHVAGLAEKEAQLGMETKKTQIEHPIGSWLYNVMNTGSAIHPRTGATITKVQ